MINLGGYLNQIYRSGFFKFRTSRPVRVIYRDYGIGGYSRRISIIACQKHWYVLKSRSVGVGE